ncbi:GDP-mannose 4,6-dehydratase [Shewanella sp. SP1S2-4]|uniref:GDP-mannose 4,6-dehydratase n=1 Tax=Shewanella sp. SP1S2-4 TaxID=3063537 RepID=UPI002890007C|nr:GDP-mannose 4,6-dehydratase [Shewanella sp. SP1S2-4]MDT3319386.1 GDP-mannose 4,6-dehydratase [Shewanella sp. SP1S2-4]
MNDINRKFQRVLITGISGSGGSFLAEYIVNNHVDVEVHGISRWHSTASHDNLNNIKERVYVHECDLLDLSSIIRVLETIKPDGIFHMAAYANVKNSFITPLSVINNNVMGTANLLEAIRLTKLNPVIQLCSTSEVYGRVEPKNVPINESCPINAVNPYSVSKVTQDLLGQSYFLSYGMKIIRTRMFTYINPRRLDLFATSFADQISRIELGLQDELFHGNLDSTRTLIDVRDAMESYWVALTKGRIGEIYNIGGENIYKVGEILEILKSKSSGDIKSRLDPLLLRPTDITLQIPDSSKFLLETGWKPKYLFEDSLNHLLDYRRRVNIRSNC